MTPEEQRDKLLEAARGVLQNIISSGSGPAVPIFDEYDAAVERTRGSWSTVDGEALNKLRTTVKEISETKTAPARRNTSTIESAEAEKL